MSLSYTKSLGCLSYYIDRDQHLNKRECCAQLIYDIFNFMFNNLPCIRCKFYKKEIVFSPCSIVVYG